MKNRTSFYFIAKIIVDKFNRCFCKRLVHNIETCYQRNKLIVSISAATIANTKSIHPMALVSSMSKSSGSIITISTIDLQNILLIPFVWLIMHLIPLLSQFHLVCLIPLGLWILLVATT